MISEFSEGAFLNCFYIKVPFNSNMMSLDVNLEAVTSNPNLHLSIAADEYRSENMGSDKITVNNIPAGDHLVKVYCGAACSFKLGFILSIQTTTTVAPTTTTTTTLAPTTTTTTTTLAPTTTTTTSTAAPTPLCVSATQQKFSEFRYTLNINSVSTSNFMTFSVSATGSFGSGGNIFVDLKSSTGELLTRVALGYDISNNNYGQGPNNNYCALQYDSNGSGLINYTSVSCPNVISANTQKDYWISWSRVSANKMEVKVGNGKVSGAQVLLQHSNIDAAVLPSKILFLPYSSTTTSTWKICPVQAVN